MEWAKFFRGREVSRGASADLPPRWNALLAQPLAAAKASVCTSLGLPASSPARRAILAGGEIVVLKWTQQKTPRPPELAVAFDKGCLLFAPPEHPETQLTSEDHTRIVHELGAMTLGPYGGRLLGSREATALANELRGLIGLEGTPPSGGLFPFFDHGTGDFDCWTDDEAFDAVCFDHETRELEPVSTGGFVPWFEERFREIMLI